MDTKKQLEIQDKDTRYLLSTNPDGTLLLDCRGTLTCVETFADGIQLAHFCNAKGINQNAFFTRIATWNKNVATQFAKGIYR